jgi:hypothetical protein
MFFLLRFCHTGFSARLLRCRAVENAGPRSGATATKEKRAASRQEKFGLDGN